MELKITTLLSLPLAEEIEKWLEKVYCIDICPTPLGSQEVAVCNMNNISKVIYHLVKTRKDSLQGASDNLKDTPKEHENWEHIAIRYARIKAELEVLEPMLAFHLKKQAIKAKVPIVNVVNGNIVHTRLFVRMTPYGHVVATNA